MEEQRTEPIFLRVCGQSCLVVRLLEDGRRQITDLIMGQKSGTKLLDLKENPEAEYRTGWLKFQEPENKLLNPEGNAESKTHAGSVLRNQMPKLPDRRENP